MWPNPGLLSLLGVKILDSRQALPVLSQRPTSVITNKTPHTLVATYSLPKEFSAHLRGLLIVDSEVSVQLSAGILRGFSICRMASFVLVLITYSGIFPKVWQSLKHIAKLNACSDYVMLSPK